jgi:ferric-dicitrate binding protein FerR (iron transport regulator)
MITLADGSTIYLDSVGGGTLAVQNDVQVMKTAEGKVVYTGATTGNGEIVYNTLFNPRGSKVIDMQLSDGSHVWLNAGSSIRYPVAFIGKERVVEINGEAYFEVARLERSNAKNAKQAQRTQSENMPFIVKKGDVSVTVLGTHFNVNAYDDEESLKVTLLEGSVAVKRASTMVKLTPGQQAIAASGKLQVASSVDVDEVMAWKNGKFVFNKTNVQTTMRQIARWYDVDIEYKDNVKGFFSGGISRLENASQLLKM